MKQTIILISAILLFILTTGVGIITISRLEVLDNSEKIMMAVLLFCGYWGSLQYTLLLRDIKEKGVQ